MANKENKDKKIAWNCPYIPLQFESAKKGETFRFPYGFKTRYGTIISGIFNIDGFKNNRNGGLKKMPIYDYGMDIWIDYEEGRDMRFSYKQDRGIIYKTKNFSFNYPRKMVEQHFTGEGSYYTRRAGVMKDLADVIKGKPGEYNITSDEISWLEKNVFDKYKNI
ncbi:MAG: hypothetical protein FK732_09680 [Asgard group archaeon]|nr:hypothetical protein [Asgard group archaeon]